MTPYTAAEKADAIERELKYRKRVYARRVAEGGMMIREANYQIAIFESIRDDYRKAAESERLV